MGKSLVWTSFSMAEQETRSNGDSAYHLRVQNNRGNFDGSDVFDTLGQMGYRNNIILFLSLAFL